MCSHVSKKKRKENVFLYNFLLKQYDYQELNYTTNLNGRMVLSIDSKNESKKNDVIVYLDLYLT